jgi:large repetitive protein
VFVAGIDIGSGSFTVNSATQITIPSFPAHAAGGPFDITVQTAAGGTSVPSSGDQYTFVPAPAITAVSPQAGPIAGGNTVTVTGTTFAGTTDVQVGNADVTASPCPGSPVSPCFTVNGPGTQITLEDLPALTSGPSQVDIIVNASGGANNPAPVDTYIYAPVPTLGTPSPVNGPVAGGNNVTLAGTGFESTNGTGANFAVTKVTIGGANITAFPCPGSPVSPCFTVNSATQIVAKDIPGHAAGATTITVTSAGGVSAGASYTYVAPPAVTGVSPPSGPASGGNQVVVTGTAFTGATDVFVAGNDISSGSFIVNGPGTQITIASFPGHAAGGPFDITVETTAGGTSAPSSGDQYTYDGPPAITGVSPQAGPTSGGNTVTVTGTAFTGTTDVLVGSTDVTASPCPGSPVSPCFTVNGGGTQITLQDLPGASAGPPVDIIVTTPGGSNSAAPVDTYVYAPVPTISGISPPAGALAGGNIITITGSGFQSSNGGSADFTTTQVTVDGIAVTGSCPGAPCFSVISSTQINVEVPADSAGTVNVTVTTQGGTSGAGSYTYAPVPTISNISPLAGVLAGGTVTINGAGFESGSAFTTTQVTVDGTPITAVCGSSPCFTVVTANQIVVQVPSHAGGTVGITVTTVGGTSTAAEYAYAPVPTITGVSPNAGPPSGANPVTITGTDFESSNGPGTNYVATSMSINGATCAITSCFVVNSPTQITIASMPADLAGGIVPITVTTLAGTSATGSNSQYNYVASFPTVTSIAPSSGAVSGGAILTINGTNFGTQGAMFAATKVNFGSTAVTTTPCPPTPTTACFNVGGPTKITVFTPPGTAGPLNVQVTTPHSTSPSDPVPADVYTYVAPGTYTPEAVPFRICDTRAHSPTPACAGRTLGAALSVQITGTQVPSTAQAVVVNLTVINHSASTTFVSAYPSGGLRPLASNVNVDPDATQANLAIVALSSGGALTVYNSIGSVDVLIDVEGYFIPATSNVGTFHPLSPVRICDTRLAPTKTNCTTGVLPGGTWRKVVVSGLPPGGTGTGIPPNTTAAAAVFNLTAVSPSAATFLAISPPTGSDACPTGHATSSNLNPRAGETEPNRVISNLGPDQDICVYNSVGTVNFVIDVNGWFSGAGATTGADFYAVPPTRICDTRTGSGTQCTPTPAAASVSLIPVAGIKVVPAIGGAVAPVAIVANLTGISGTASTFLELYPADASTRPGSSDLNPAAHDVIANLDIVALATTVAGLNGNVRLFNSVGSINVVIDVAGWFQ